ncbi:phage portal protein [Candidatus Parcubacteria bacterium]|nr:MAG: phage portal protein [Candidatus Parcubacteria bacterium]
MSLLLRLLQPDSFEARASADDDFWYTHAPSGPTKTGLDIDETNVIQIATVWACVRVIAETIASLPRFVYERLEKGKKKAINHPLYNLIHLQPNPESSGMQFHETMLHHLLLWGNFYAEKQINQRNELIALWPWNPAQTSVERDRETSQLMYTLQLGNGKDPRKLPRERMFHIAGLSFNGVTGLSPIANERETFGLAMATQEFGSRFFGNFAKPGGVMEHPGQITDEVYKRLQASWQEGHAGLHNAHKLAILEEGMTFKPITMPLEDAQFLETRKFQQNQIAAIFRVPPHMIGDLERATWGNIEFQSLDFVVHCIRPWLVRIEQAWLLQLFKPEERRRFFAEHVVDGLLRGDFKSRMEGYAIGKNNGFMSSNDIRELENMNPIPEEQGGNTYLIPANMLPAERALNPEPEPQETMPEPEEQPQRRERMRSAFTRWFADATARIVRRESAAIGNQAKKFMGIYALEDFEAWLDSFYGDLPAFIGLQLEPVVSSYCDTADLNGQAGTFCAAFLEDFSGRHISESKNLILATAKQADRSVRFAAIENMVNEWTEGRAEHIAEREIDYMAALIQENMI